MPVLEALTSMQREGTRLLQHAVHVDEIAVIQVVGFTSLPGVTVLQMWAVWVAVGRPHSQSIDVQGDNRVDGRRQRRADAGLPQRPQRRGVGAHVFGRGSGALRLRHAADGPWHGAGRQAHGAQILICWVVDPTISSILCLLYTCRLLPACTAAELQSIVVAPLLFTYYSVPGGWSYNTAGWHQQHMRRARAPHRRRPVQRLRRRHPAGAATSRYHYRARVCCRLASLGTKQCSRYASIAYSQDGRPVLKRFQQRCRCWRSCTMTRYDACLSGQGRAQRSSCLQNRRRPAAPGWLACKPYKGHRLPALGYGSAGTCHTRDSHFESLDRLARRCRSSSRQNEYSILHPIGAVSMFSTRIVCPITWRL